MSENKIFTVATSHLDTVWRWELPKTINEFLPDTLEKNFNLIERYPEYKINFEGAYRYELIEEYYPDAFEELKEHIKNGKWIPSGSQYENGDVNIPSPEAIIRNINYGNKCFEDKFGKNCKDIFLPDGFGFGWALPSIAKHCNLLGFATQKLGWGGAYERPFDLGIWRGVDSSEIYAVLNPLSYRNKINGDVRANVNVISKLADAGINGSLPWTEVFYGTGDWGGAPDDLSAKSVAYSVRKNKKDNNTKVISAASDEMFKELEKLPKSEKASLPIWNNELVMRSHGVGSYTSRTMSKRLNSKNEILADQTERACVAASLLTSYKYPSDNLDEAWKRVIAHQFHDDITGTSTMKQYNDSYNDYYLSLLQFKNEYEGAVGAIANELDTSWCEECAVIVHNPVAIKRKSGVEAHIKLKHNSKSVAVFDSKGKEVPSQVIRKQGKEFDIVFLADIDSTAFKVYDVRASDKKCPLKSDLQITEHTLENSKYRLILNKNGDIASIIDKELSKQILDKPIKLALHNNLGELNYPSWEIRKEDIESEPYLFANTPKFKILENGPARIALKVSRHAQSSKIEQVISLEAGAQFIKVDNFIDWQERRTLLKAQFPFACENEEASYDLGLGCIKRGNNQDNLYEVPAQKWADISGDEYGVSIFSDCKYGWDKPSNNTLRLTCIHTPAGAFTKDARQDLQDIGRNIFSFGVFSHKGDISSKTSQQSQFFSFPLVAFQTSSRRKGNLDSDFSLLKSSSNNVIIRAIKKAERDDDIVIRVNSSSVKEIKDAKISFFADILEANETYGSEEVIKKAKTDKNSLIFSLKPYEIKTFKLKLNCEKNTAKENFRKLELDFNAQGITSDSNKVNVILQGSGCSLPDELLKKSRTVQGITFRMPSSETLKNVLIAREQEIDIPKGTTKLYMLAASTIGDKDITIYTDNKEKHLTIHSMRENVFQWDMAGLSQSAKIKDAKIGLILSHTHHPEGNLANEKAYFFIYEIDVRNCKKLILPEENKVVILAMTAVKRFSNTYLATNLFDKVEGEYEFGSIPPIDKIIDKADFITIRAGKIQDQINGGKGQGFKRDNIITNIIRSYTKSEW